MLKLIEFVLMIIECEKSIVELPAKLSTPGPFSASRVPESTRLPAAAICSVPPLNTYLPLPLITSDAVLLLPPDWSKAPLPE